ncbi:MAG TPA: glycerol-3-phosphate 1-O-acyltransferase PlsY [Anaerovoracaceae bacterium]|nr:glycerol-3-phosphate 1-O-acyltransferase PlsY [Anaerovoracaceae bacterium]
MSSLFSVAAIVISYFLGNISPAILIGRAMGIDIREEGSGNAGTTNVLRVLGKRAAAATLAIDILKGVAAVFLGEYAGGQEIAMACGLAALIGHIWPMVFQFRGGKGIATAFGIVLALEPILGLIEAAAALFFMLVSQRVSVGSVAAAILLPIASYFFDPAYLPLTVAMAAIVIFKHRSNLKRLMKGEEPKVNFNRQGDKK